LGWVAGGGGGGGGGGAPPPPPRPGHRKKPAAIARQPRKLTSVPMIRFCLDQAYEADHRLPE
jgi:hypothetical protein